MNHKSRSPWISTFRLLAGFVAIWAFGAQAADNERYLLAPGDEIRIDVYDEADLSMQAKLEQSGMITYPYLGQIRATGRTVNELTKLITEGLLGDILIKPQVSVSIVRFRDFFVAGEVAKVGGYEYQPGLTVEKAITLAGGLTEFGSMRRIEIKREGSAEARQASVTTTVEPGDTITVMEGLF